MAEDRVMQSLLLDFYGELLTDKQRECCGISRQGVWDNSRRGVAMRTEIEEKTGLIRRFSETQKGLDELDDTVRALLSLPLDAESGALAEKLRLQIRALRTRG